MKNINPSLCISGVYKITNRINNKYYIGSSKNICERYRSHLCSLIKGNSKCTILQNAVNKYGIENFEFSIVEICENYKQREIEILSSSLPPYNAILETHERREISKETRIRMSNSQKIRHLKTPPPKGYKRENFKRMVKSTVILTDTKSNEILTFLSVMEASNHFKTSLSALYHAHRIGSLYRYRYKVEIIKPKKYES